MIVTHICDFGSIIVEDPRLEGAECFFLYSLSKSIRIVRWWHGNREVAKGGSEVDQSFLQPTIALSMGR